MQQLNKSKNSRRTEHRGTTFFVKAKPQSFFIIIIMSYPIGSSEKMFAVCMDYLNQKVHIGMKRNMYRSFISV